MSITVDEDMFGGVGIIPENGNIREMIYFSEDPAKAKKEAAQLVGSLIKHFELELKDLVG